MFKMTVLEHTKASLLARSGWLQSMPGFRMTSRHELRPASNAGISQAILHMAVPNLIEVAIMEFSQDGRWLENALSGVDKTEY